MGISGPVSINYLNTTTETHPGLISSMQSVVTIVRVMGVVSGTS